MKQQRLVRNQRNMQQSSQVKAVLLNKHEVPEMDRDSIIEKVEKLARMQRAIKREEKSDEDRVRDIKSLQREISGVKVIYDRPENLSEENRRNEFIKSRVKKPYDRDS